ncbi:MAG: enoyl-CoA hydratase/isomerase family protein [Phycisphaerales bacterium]|nr:enoyl-CoA hydratase/isomerase family protein [Phycisphaerales bacterium]
MPVILDISEPTAVLSLNSPDRHNALTSEMFEGITKALDEVDGRHSGPVLRINGNGPSFCSGFDLDVCAVDRPSLEHFLVELSRIARRLRRMEKVVIAEVHGRALAGGCALLTACDLTCVTADAKIGYPVHRIGVSPAVSIPTLVNCIGAGHSTELMLSGRIIDGKEARRIGLAHTTSDSREELEKEVDEIAASICRKGPNALAVTKRWLNQVDGSDEDGPFDATLAASIETGHSEEADRMLMAHHERRR